MKQRIYPKIVKGDECDVESNEILWIDNEDGTVDLKKINALGKLVSIVKTGTPTPEEPIALNINKSKSAEAEETESTNKNILD